MIRELRGGVTQTSQPLKLARERNGGKVKIRRYGCLRYQTFTYFVL
ncbi:hypothetical protein J2T20_002385 [Paenibacillus wynnii]|nr:hypothetical protein [Paenibacillus wynnii]